MTASTSAEREARRTALILAAAQAIVGSAAVVAFSLGAIAGLPFLFGAIRLADVRAALASLRPAAAR